MKNKYTFLTLCDSYSKIEIPIIQRDYAQGRDTINVKNLREKFINDFLIGSLLSGKPIELDFVYGSIIIENIKDEKHKVFIPLDGQQRLTTLFLLHFFIALKEEKLELIRKTLSKFTYETRPSAKDFISKLLQIDTIISLSKMKYEIIDSVWFNEDWKLDPTVSGMLNVLDTFANNSKLIHHNNLFEKLIDQDNPVISFYFTDLDEFGLSENLYIRMNARGKLLSDFENFKSEFSKIIQIHHDLSELIKDKIEYEWIDNLWEFREHNSYIIDKPFMSYLSFITEMIYFKNAEYRSNSPYVENFLNLNTLSITYSSKENLNFLIFSLDFIKEISKHDSVILLDGESLKGILKQILEGKRDTTQLFIMYQALVYNYQKKAQNNLYDYLRVVRNLIVNTDENSRREWPRLLNSLYKLISDENIYLKLSKDKDTIIGFRVEQRREEIFKAKLITEFPEIKDEIFKMEDHKYLKGRILNLLQSPFILNEDDFNIENLDTIIYDTIKFKELFQIFTCYEEISENNFNYIWGNLLISNLYVQTPNSRLNMSGRYTDHPSIIIFAKKYAISKKDLSEFVISVQKDFINSTKDKYPSFKEIRNVKEQLYIYYIIEERIYNRKYHEFFKNHNFNFGWLSKENNYKSLFTSGIEGCQYFPNTNPIFQVYNQQFRYNLKINQNNTLEIETIGGSKKRNPFELIQEWAVN